MSRSGGREGPAGCPRWLRPSPRSGGSSTSRGHTPGCHTGCWASRGRGRLAGCRAGRSRGCCTGCRAGQGCRAPRRQARCHGWRESAPRSGPPQRPWAARPPLLPGPPAAGAARGPRPTPRPLRSAPAAQARGRFPRPPCPARPRPARPPRSALGRRCRCRWRRTRRKEGQVPGWGRGSPGNAGRPLSEGGR